MLHGYDRAPIERMRERIVFLKDDSGVLRRSRGGDWRATTSRSTPAHSLAHVHNRRDPDPARARRCRAFVKLQELPSRRQVDGWIMAPGYDQGALLYQVGGGRLSPIRLAETNRSLINRAPGWETPYVEEDLACYDDAKATLDHMISWFTDNPHHHHKIMQTIAFKVQNPLVKPQFALAVVGGQGIGKSTFFYEVMRARARQERHRDLGARAIQLAIHLLGGGRGFTADRRGGRRHPRLLALEAAAPFVASWRSISNTLPRVRSGLFRSRSI